MKSFLIIAYAYPPISSPGAVRATRMVKFLGEFGWAAAVLTVKDGYSLRIGGLDDPLHEEQNRITRCPDPIAIANTRYGENPESFAKPKFGTAIKSKLKAGVKSLLFPDRSILWARKIAKLYNEEQNYSLIYSSSPTASTHLAGYSLSRKYKLPWVAEFRDPLSWLDNKNPASKLRRWGLAKYEAWVVKHASAVVVVSETFKDYFEEIYPKANILSIPNGAEFDIDELESVIKNRKSRKFVTGKPIRLVHTGSFYGGARPPGPLIEACKLAMKNSDLQFELLCAGNDAYLATEAAERLGCPEVVKDVGVLPHNETLDLLRSADANISLLMNEEIAKISIMSKFLDYLPAGAPILNLGADDYVLSRIINEQGAGASYAFDDIEGIANWLTALPTAKQPDTIRLCQDWSAQKMAERMADLFEDIT